MEKEFEISMIGELNLFLGLQISQDSMGIFVSQSKYLKEMLQKFGMIESSPVSTLMIAGCKFNKEDESPAVNQTMYGSIIGSLLYLTASRLDIMQAVGLVARFQANPKESHMRVVKRIFRYIKGIMDCGLWYPKDEYFDLKEFMM